MQMLYLQYIFNALQDNTSFGAQLFNVLHDNGTTVTAASNSFLGSEQTCEIHI